MFLHRREPPHWAQFGFGLLKPVGVRAVKIRGRLRHRRTSEEKLQASRILRLSVNPFNLRSYLWG